MRRRAKRRSRSCVEDSVNLQVNGIRVASLTITPADLEPFALGYVVCEGLVRTPEEVLSIEVEYPNINVTVNAFTGDDADLWMEIRSSGCVGVRAAWADIDDPIKSDITLGRGPDLYRARPGQRSRTAVEEHGRHTLFDHI